mgnify:FL=1
MKRILISILSLVIIGSSYYNISHKSLSTINQVHTENLDLLIKQAEYDLISLRKAIDSKDLNQIKSITDSFLLKAYEIDKDDVDNQSQLTQLFIVMRNYEALYKFAKEGNEENIESAYQSLKNSVIELINMVK